MRSRMRALPLTLTLAALAAIAACSAPEASTFPDPKPAEGDTVPGFDTTLVPAEFAACASGSSAVEAKPVFLAFMFDNSGSMIRKLNEKGETVPSPKWEAAKAAAKEFFGASGTKASASLGLFPNGGDTYSCEAKTYAVPQVSMTALPNADFGDVLDVSTPTKGATPTWVALSGALEYAKGVQLLKGDEGKVAVVLVTDGIPDSYCAGNSVPEVRELAARDADVIPTYVIGVGRRLSDLNSIAEGGGTKQAIIIDDADGAQIQRDLLGAIQNVNRLATPCDYDVPAAPKGQQLDFSKINVVLTKTGGEPEALTHDPDCDGAGWKFDDANRKVVLCKASCEAANAAPARVDLLFGCATKGAPVR